MLPLSLTSRDSGDKMEPISVLLVDDNPAFLSAAARFLQYHDEIVLVGTAAGGKDGFEQCQKLKPDIVLVDLCMTDLPGLELIPQLRAALPRIGIIALTAMDFDAYRQAALAAGADDFVTKGRITTDLLPAIQLVAQSRRSDQGPQNKSSEETMG